MAKPNPLQDLISKLETPVNNNETIYVINGFKVKNSYLVAFVRGLQDKYPPEEIIEMLLSLDKSVEQQDIKNNI